MRTTFYPLPTHTPAAPWFSQNPNHNLEHVRITLPGIHVFHRPCVRIHGVLTSAHGPVRLAEAPGTHTYMYLLR